ncbi:hypothetical protein B0J17DRAFT_773168 [Rhizoctonia solani]|nr:hypothetical protein B0J17DRAFT_773168 [Rhizoctonia solani]
MLNLDEVPPLDVLMAWHTYMLNPRVYYEDGVTKKSRLLGILAFPFNLIDGIIDIDTLAALRPSQCRREHFESLTGQIWTCPPNTGFTDTVFVPCPRCEHKTLNEVFWIKQAKTGFGENDFKAQCRTCMGVIDRTTMMVRAVCDDIFRVLPGLIQSAGSLTSQAFISGTLLNWRTGQPDYEGAAVGNKVLLKHFLDSASMRGMSGNKLAKSIDYSVKKLETVLKEALSLRDGGSLVTRILSYYRCPYYPFSIELCGAILRQGGFIDRLFSLGWIEPRTFDQDPTVIYRCIARYYAWLEVMSQVSQKMLVPTLDIDLVWHTHQLKQQDYRIWTLDVMGEFVDHDDKVEENKLSDAYDQTAEHWEQRWGVPYHVCGCIHPSQDKPFDPSEKLSRIFRGKSKHPDFTNPQPHLVSTHDCESGSTHPSEHNSIVIVQQTLFQTRREDRTHKREKWAKQLRSDVDKGKVPPDGWEAMSVQRAGGHEPGFMRPMPDSNLDRRAPIVPYGPETCAAHQGGVLNGANLSSTPMDGSTQPAHVL